MFVFIFVALLVGAVIGYLVMASIAEQDKKKYAERAKWYEGTLLDALKEIATHPHPVDSLNNWLTAVRAIERHYHSENHYFYDYPLIQHYLDNFSEYKQRIKFINFAFIKVSDRIACEVKKTQAEREQEIAQIKDSVKSLVANAVQFIEADKRRAQFAQEHPEMIKEIKEIAGAE